MCDDELNVLPVTRAMRKLQPVAAVDAEAARAVPARELAALRSELEGHEPAHTLVSQAKTPAQVSILTEKKNDYSWLIFREIGNGFISFNRCYCW